MYLIHYVFAVWFQYALLGAGLFAIGKAAIVFGGTLIMQPSTEYLLIRQVSALISATADATAPSKEYAPLMEARLYEALTVHCAEKQRIAAIFAKSGFATAPRGLIYW